MESPQPNNPTTATHMNSEISSHHKLNDNWTLWAHLPDNIDWSLKSYIPIYTFKTVEEMMMVTETIPNVLVENCMLFMMKDGVKPTWEDPQNRNGGSFSYKISNSIVCKVWKELIYAVVGLSVSSNMVFSCGVSGITISPKKNFCIVKIWMSDCKHQNPSVVTSNIKGLLPHGCIFKKHKPEF
tara:strand:+ start:78 stop:626 length:549 start_codon:yes stop_codon:yes gene_type:complete